MPASRAVNGFAGCYRAAQTNGRLLGSGQNTAPGRFRLMMPPRSPRWREDQLKGITVGTAPLAQVSNPLDNGRMRTTPDLVVETRTLLSALADEGVGYPLCGGLAANIYGADRFTVDIDLLIAPDDLERALTVAKRCGFTIDAGLLPLLGGARQMHRVVKLVTGWEEPLQLDLLIADGGGRFSRGGDQRFSIRTEWSASRCRCAPIRDSLERNRGSWA